VVKILEDDKQFNRISNDNFCRIDVKGSGITLKQIQDQFGHDNDILDESLLKELEIINKKGNNSEYIIDKQNYKKYLAKGLEILLKEL